MTKPSSRRCWPRGAGSNALDAAFWSSPAGKRASVLRTGGCAPDIATVRSSEAGAASQYFAADAILLTLPDGGGVIPPAWPDVTATIAAYIQAFDPELVVTFDPRHGTTCHPDHRAAANVVIDAVKRLASPPQLYLLETKVSITPDPFAIHFVSATSSAERYDANKLWNAVIEDMQRHPSQFDDRWITAVQNVPPSERSVFLARAETILQQSVATCP